jgi:hypothetical protein
MYVLVGRHEVKGQLDRSRRRWRDTVEMNPKEIRWAMVD